MTAIHLPKGFICTFSGRMIEPLNPSPSDIYIEDIAHALANQCRFTGHTKEFYSVAQHSVLVSEICDEQDALWGLLHDGTEAYLADLARPIKHGTEWGKSYQELENKLMAAIAIAFELEINEDWFMHGMPPSVKTADLILLRTEMRDLMPEGLKEANYGDTLDVEIECWTPKDAKLAFLERYFEIVEG